MTPAGRPFYRRGRGGVRGNDPFGPRRGGSDKGRSVNNSSCPGYPREREAAGEMLECMLATYAASVGCHPVIRPIKVESWPPCKSLRLGTAWHESSIFLAFANPRRFALL